MTTSKRSWVMWCSVVAAAAIGTGGVALAHTTGGSTPSSGSPDSVEAFRVPDAVHGNVRIETLQDAGANAHARLLTGEGTRPGFACLVLVDADGATVGCHQPEDLPKAGGVALRAYRPDGSSTMVLHLPRDRAVTSLEVGGRSIPAPALPLALLDLGPEDDAVAVNTEGERVVHRFERGSEAFDMGID